MLNPALEPQLLGQQFLERGRLQISDVLLPDAARALYRCLDKEVPWTLAYKAGEQSVTMDNEAFKALPDEQYALLRTRILEQAKSEFQFMYLSYMMVSAYLEQRNPNLILNRVVEYLNGAEFLNFARKLTGLSDIRKADCQATCYRAGHFLKYHNDDEATQERLVAYVLGLTPSWSADSGGLLQFLNAAGGVEETFMPRFNTLTLFRVPADHCVSYVSDYCVQSRYSITGWLRRS